MSDDGWKDRCDWCNWPLEFDLHHPENDARRPMNSGGCSEDRCSMGPPGPVLDEVGKLKRRIRDLEKAIGVSVSTVCRCYLQFCENEGEREFTQSVLDRVNKVMGHNF